MPQDWVAQNDSDLLTQAQSFQTQVAAIGAATLGLTAGQMTAFGTLVTDFSTALTAYTASLASEVAALNGKETAKVDLAGGLRNLGGIVQVNPGTTDVHRGQLGLTVRDTIRTPSGTPTTRPVLVVKTDQRMEHTIGFADEGTPTKKAKPKDVFGIELWSKVDGPVPIDYTQCSLLALDTNTPYLVQYTGAEGNKTVHYMARWIGVNGTKGPWSETVSATVGA